MEGNTTAKMTKETGQFNSNWRIAAYYMKCLTTVGQATEGFPYKELWTQIFDDMTWEERERLIMTQKKREVKKVAKFVPEGLEKPKTVINLIRDDYRKKCVTEGTEYTNAGFNAYYKSLTEDARAPYRLTYEKSMVAYLAKTAEQKASKVESGDYPEDKPKGALSNYMIFSMECRKPGNKFLTAEEKKSLDTLPMKDGAKVIAEAFKRVKATKPEYIAEIQAIADADKARHTKEMYDWNIRALERQLRKAEAQGADTGSIATRLMELRSKPPVSVAKAAAPAAKAVESTPAAKPAGKGKKGKGDSA